MADSKPGKRIFIIAGPNGAGKSTFAAEFLPKEGGSVPFINADMIAQELSPSNPEAAALAAGKAMLREIDRRASEGESFAVETTLATRIYLRRIRRWRAAGYDVRLLFLSLPSVDMAIDRVASRVCQGGHNIPEDVIRRRFVSGLNNFHNLYKTVVTGWRLYDNSRGIRRLVDQGGEP